MKKLKGFNLNEQVIKEVNNFLRKKFKSREYYDIHYNAIGLLEIEKRKCDYIEYRDNQFWAWAKWGNPLYDFKNIYTDKVAVEKYVNAYNREKISERIKQLQDSLDNFDTQANEIKERTKSELSKYQDDLKKLNETKENENE